MPNDILYRPGDGLVRVVTFSAGLFTAAGSMTWTVAEADVKSFWYSMLGPNLMHITFDIQSSTIGGTPSTELRVAIPNNMKAVGDQTSSGLVVDNGVQGEIGRFGPADGNAYVRAFRQDPTSNWTATTDNCWLGWSGILRVEPV
jgi:hypothetical protein